MHRLWSGMKKVISSGHRMVVSSVAKVSQFVQGTNLEKLEYAFNHLQTLYGKLREGKESVVPLESVPEEFEYLAVACEDEFRNSFHSSSSSSDRKGRRTTSSSSSSSSSATPQKDITDEATIDDVTQFLLERNVLPFLFSIAVEDRPTRTCHVVLTTVTRILQVCPMDIFARHSRDIADFSLSVENDPQLLDAYGKPLAHLVSVVLRRLAAHPEFVPLLMDAKDSCAQAFPIITAFIPLLRSTDFDQEFRSYLMETAVSLAQCPHGALMEFLAHDSEFPNVVVDAVRSTIGIPTNLLEMASKEHTDAPLIASFLDAVAIVDRIIESGTHPVAARILELFRDRVATTIIHKAFIGAQHEEEAEYSLGGEARSPKVVWANLLTRMLSRLSSLDLFVEVCLRIFENENVIRGIHDWIVEGNGTDGRLLASLQLVRTCLAVPSEEVFMAAIGHHLDNLSFLKDSFPMEISAELIPSLFPSPFRPSSKSNDVDSTWGIRDRILDGIAAYHAPSQWVSSFSAGDEISETFRIMDPRFVLDPRPTDESDDDPFVIEEERKEELDSEVEDIGLLLQALLVRFSLWFDTVDGMAQEELMEIFVMLAIIPFPPLQILLLCPDAPIVEGVPTLPRVLLSLKEFVNNESHDLASVLHVHVGDLFAIQDPILQRKVRGCVVLEQFGRALLCIGEQWDRIARHEITPRKKGKKEKEREEMRRKKKATPSD
eukprot:TRINITY_DN927_c0_g1_i1.p1 TRINITY_DN927_c0_g1~~TRINITY_DN927_c0_g1_i1.p1  ORF type:complete len:716 (+),score=218.79 TRINITY_DN927_c0_g1_i1:146-2293(+)